MKDGAPLGDRMKCYESLFTSQKIMPLVPVVARMDGRAFHSFCKPFDRPFDQRFIDVMDATCKSIVKETGANIGYVQSDEITIVFLQDSYSQQIYFDGRVFKMISSLATLTTTLFHKNYRKIFLNDTGDWLYRKNPMFDARVFTVPNLDEAANAVLWRIQDAWRNSVLMLGQHHFSHKTLHGMKCKEIITKLENEKGVIWGNLPSRFKSGSLLRKERKINSYTLEERNALPSNHPGKNDPHFTFERSVISSIDIPRELGRARNKSQVLFYGSDIEF